MKNLYKAALLVALGLASVTAAQAVTYNGDLLIGLTTQSGDDLVYDIGAESSLANGETWNLTTALSAAGINTSSSGLLWGVVGSKGTSGPEWLTDVVTPAGINHGQATAINSSVGALVVNDFSTVGEGNYATPANTVSYSWNEETAQGASGAGSAYSSEYTDPNLGGEGSIAFYSSTTAGVVTDLGSFSLSGDELTFNVTAVPEPATYGIIGGIGVLLLGLRRQLIGKLA